jgi:H+/Cl- antiporter ClcA
MTQSFATHWTKASLLSLIACQMCGCALHYYDRKTGIEHVWGIGHLRMKARQPAEGVRAVVTGSTTIGARVSVGEENASTTIGFAMSNRIVVQDDSAVRLEWPDSSFFNVRVGTEFPPALQPQSK